MENVRKRLEMQLVSKDSKIQKLINRPTFKHVTPYNENLSAVSLAKNKVKFDKPMYVGFAVLEISKTLMYDYHYNVMKKHYKDSITLMYTDTGKIFISVIINIIIINIIIIILDSLVYLVKTADFYADLLTSSDLLDRMDTANLPRDHPCFIAEREKIPGLFSDETNGETMTEFVALRAKSYAYTIEGKEEIKAKGIREHVVRNHMTLEDHKRCLFGDEELMRYTENVSIRSFKHQLMTIKSNKLTYNSNDDKRYVLEDKVHTLAHGHYKIE
jgi:hypothetical protein